MGRITNQLATPLNWTSTEDYSAFDRLDGRHPWQEHHPYSCVLYPVRRLPDGEVVYFNFELAKEMGLIASDHPHVMNSQLRERILSTFCLQIINEYDEASGRQFPKDTLKPHPYMATRYLQLQHKDRKGRTSGDGRSIWNGSLTHRGVTWDVSSRGTGVTRLAPGAVEAGKNLRTGDTSFGYGCGMADLDELMSCALMSEIFHKNQIPTERTLCVIDLGKGLAIGVRAGTNLTRPAHIFLHLKQKEPQRLRAALDSFIERQVRNRRWNMSLRSSAKRDQKALYQIAKSYAEFAAKLEREYVFCWLDWDGDNCLADAAILDYGSIRMFGLRHDQYRYDDVERFSTNLNEQPAKARLIVQVFAQAFDFAGRKKFRPLSQYGKHPVLRYFDQHFRKTKRELLLKQCGWTDVQVERILKNKASTLRKLEDSFHFFETAKAKRRFEKLPDGINRPARFNMRRFLRDLPETLLQLDLSTQELPLYFSLMEAESQSSIRFSPGHRKQLKVFLKAYLELVQCSHQDTATTLLEMAQRANQMCRPHRITGNSVEHVVWELLKFRRRGGSLQDLQELMDAFIQQQTVAPEHFLKSQFRWVRAAEAPQTATDRVFKSMMDLVTSFEEDI